jgi:hypothetical protein
VVTKEELTAIADVVLVNWNLNLAGDRRAAFYRTWWRYLRDLDGVTCRAAVDRWVLDDKPFPPRAGTIRREVLLPASEELATLEQAWSQAQARLRAVRQGTWTECSPLVLEALRRCGAQEDEQAFTRAWRDVVAEVEARFLALPDDDGDEVDA